VGVLANFDFNFNGLRAGASTGLTLDLSSAIKVVIEKRTKLSFPSNVVLQRAEELQIVQPFRKA
jgi:hypothetical protein